MIFSTYAKKINISMALLFLLVGVMSPILGSYQQAEAAEAAGAIAYVDGEDQNFGDESDINIQATRLQLSNAKSTDSPNKAAALKPVAKENTDSEKVAKFTTKSQCILNVSKVDLATAKSYTDIRAKARYAQLNKYSGRVDSSSDKIQKSYKENLSKYQINDSTKIDIVAHKKEIKNELTATQDTIKKKRKAASIASTSRAVAEQVCSMVFDVRVYTYLDGKISQQTEIDRLYRYNGLLQAQYTTLQNKNEPTATRSQTLDTVSNPAETRKKIDQLQAKLGSITPESINKLQAQNKKKSLDIYKELLTAAITDAETAIKKDISTANAAKKSIKGNTNNITNQQNSVGKSAFSSKNKPLKAKLSTAEIDSICNVKSNTRLLVKDSIDKDLRNSCNIGIKEGFKTKKSMRDAAKFCKTGNGKWNASKSPKKSAACQSAYENGSSLKDKKDDEIAAQAQ